MKHIVGNEVGELTVLRVPPRMFRRIEFRGVWREPLDFESRAVPSLQGSRGTAVSAKPVDDEGDGPANLAQQPGDEQIEVLGREWGSRASKAVPRASVSTFEAGHRSASWAGLKLALPPRPPFHQDGQLLPIVKPPRL